MGGRAILGITPRLNIASIKTHSALPLDYIHAQCFDRVSNPDVYHPWGSVHPVTNLLLDLVSGFPVLRE